MALAGGCGDLLWGREDRAKVDLGVAAVSSPLANSAAFRDTIGALTYYEGMTPMHVRSYGVVVGLGKNGSRDCPKSVYHTLVERLYKQRRLPGGAVGGKRISPEELIDALDTAVVVVQGAIPPAASVGNRFDVTVSVLPGTQTKSLRGGRLFATNLDVFRTVSTGKSITGRALAKASGPLFLNPFSSEQAATRSSPHRAIILGGGRVTLARRVRLVLLQPSYLWAKKIQDRINAQFSGAQKIADAVSPSFVQLRIPHEHREDPGHFLALVRSLYITRDPQLAAARAQLLGHEILLPESPHAMISLAFEGLGRSALPVVQPLFAHRKEYVSFHAAVAGLRLLDHLAGDAIALHATSATSKYRFQAIRALGEARAMGSVATVLRGLLDNQDPRVRIAAYDALIGRGDVIVESTPVAGDNFVLDIMATAQPNLIYAKRSQARRIALFGRDIRCEPPLFYRSLDGGITMTADEGAETVTLLRQVVATGSVSPPVPGPLELPALIELLGRDAGVGLNDEVIGLGLDYGPIVQVLNQLCADGAINARFMLEQPNAAELFGPSPPTGRPESEK